MESQLKEANRTVIYVYTHIHMQRFGWRAQREGTVWSNPGHPITSLSTCSPDVLVSPCLQTCSVPVAQIPLCLWSKGCFCFSRPCPAALSPPSWPGPAGTSSRCSLRADVWRARSSHSGFQLWAWNSSWP